MNIYYGDTAVTVKEKSNAGFILPVYARVRQLQLAVTSTLFSLENLRHRSCCGRNKNLAGITGEALPATVKHAGRSI